MRINRKLIFIITLLLLVGIFVSMAKYPAVAQETPTREGYFDSNFFCEEITFDAKRPPVKWLNITLGVSTLDDLWQTLAQFGYTYNEFFRDDYRVVFLPPPGANYWKFGAYQPTHVSACIEDGIVTLIHVDVASLETPLTFEAIFAEKGPADGVTWGTTSPSFRLLFWFEHGFALNVTVTRNSERNMISDPRIMGCIYFPSQDTEGYETRYPYNRTLPSRNPSQFKPYEGESTLQNPFNFDALSATMTAQPSPVATIVPTKESAYHTPQDFCP